MDQSSRNVASRCLPGQKQNKGRSSLKEDVLKHALVRYIASKNSGVSCAIEWIFASAFANLEHLLELWLRIRSDNLIQDRRSLLIVTTLTSHTVATHKRLKNGQVILEKIRSVLPRRSQILNKLIQGLIWDTHTNF